MSDPLQFQISCMLLYRQPIEAVEAIIGQIKAGHLPRSGSSDFLATNPDNFPRQFARRHGVTSIDDMHSALVIGMNNGKDSPFVLLHDALSIGVASEAELIFWTPAGTLSNVRMLHDEIVSTGPDDAYPILSILDFDTDNVDHVISKGLAAFGHPELRFSTQKIGLVGAIKRSVRIAHSIIIEGARFKSGQVDGLEAGEIICFTPSNDRGLIDLRSQFVHH